MTTYPAHPYRPNSYKSAYTFSNLCCQRLGYRTATRLATVLQTSTPYSVRDRTPGSMARVTSRLTSPDPNLPSPHLPASTTLNPPNSTNKRGQKPSPALIHPRPRRVT